MTTEKRLRSGTHRTATLEETSRKLRPLLSRLGITRVANVTGLDVIGTPVVAVHRPNSRSLSVSFGKGATLESARTSGIMEALESFHAESILHPLLLASHDELAAQKRITKVEALPRLSISAYHPQKPILWIEGRELTHDVSMWLPYEIVHTDFRVPFPTGTGCFYMSSNGLASGNHLLEAKLHALCELIERDATTLWTARRPEARRLSRIDIASVDDSLCLAVFAQLEAAGMAFAVWETTSDLGVAAFIATVIERGVSSVGAVGGISGMGCHPVREIALLRAVTEAIQGRLTLISGARDDLSHQLYRERRNDERAQRIAREIANETCPRKFHDVPTFDGASIEADLSWVMARTVAAGLEEIVAVDLTIPEFDIPVVRVVVPGLELMHDATGYVPGARARRVMGGST